MSNQSPTTMAVDSWTRVEDACTTAESLSQLVHESVEIGVDTEQLVPLLHRQQAAVTHLQSALHTLVQQPQPGRAERRDSLDHRLSRLLQTHAASFDALSARGVRLGGRQRIR